MAAPSRSPWIVLMSGAFRSARACRAVSQAPLSGRTFSITCQIPGAMGCHRQQLVNPQQLRVDPLPS